MLDSFELEHPAVCVVRLRPAFIFKRESAAEQRRLFMGPLVPNALLRREWIPLFPDMPGLRFQALHSADAADAYRLAVVQPVSGAFNLAAEPVLDARALAPLLGARIVEVPVSVARFGMALAWHLRLIPPEPALLDLALSLPVMDTTRARAELGWAPRHSALDAVEELLEGLHHGAGMSTPPLEAGGAGRLRRREFQTGMGEKP